MTSTLNPSEYSDKWLEKRTGPQGEVYSSKREARDSWKPVEESYREEKQFMKEQAREDVGKGKTLDSAQYAAYKIGKRHDIESKLDTPIPDPSDPNLTPEQYIFASDMRQLQSHLEADHSGKALNKYRVGTDTVAAYKNMMHRNADAIVAHEEGLKKGIPDAGLAKPLKPVELKSVEGMPINDPASREHSASWVASHTGPDGELNATKRETRLEEKSWSNWKRYSKTETKEATREAHDGGRTLSAQEVTAYELNKKYDLENHPEGLSKPINNQLWENAAKTPEEKLYRDDGLTLKTALRVDHQKTNDLPHQIGSQDVSATQTMIKENAPAFARYEANMEKVHEAQQPARPQIEPVSLTPAPAVSASSPKPFADIDIHKYGQIKLDGVTGGHEPAAAANDSVAPKQVTTTPETAAAKSASTGKGF